MKSYNGFPPEQRIRAQRWLNAEYASGRRIRPTVCAACGQHEGLIDSHAEDYSEPFGDHTDAYPLCYVCHMMLHCRFAAPAAWDTYREAVRDGYQAPAQKTRDFQKIRRILAGYTPLWRECKNAPCERTVLDDISDGILTRRATGE